MDEEKVLKSKKMLKIKVKFTQPKYFFQVFLGYNVAKKKIQTLLLKTTMDCAVRMVFKGTPSFYLS